MITREFRTEHRGSTITAVLHITGADCTVLVTGGQKEHVGAVSLCGGDGAVQTLTFPGHKEQFITEPWSRRIHAVTGGNVSVTAGIHYDKLTKEEIEQVMTAVDALLDEILSWMKIVG